MKNFSILDPALKVDAPYFLEASAGTGKTFCIEHLVVRLVLEKGTSIDRILVVTFTRAATRELRQRIRHCLQRAAEQLRSGSIEWEYLEGGSLLRLEDAIATFDEAQIHTIHGFCGEVLAENPFEGDVSATFSQIEGGLTRAQQERVIKDFFRMGLRPEAYSPGQVERALKIGYGDHEKLVKNLLRELSRGKKIVRGPTFEESLQAFQQGLQQLSHISGGALLKEFEELRGNFKGLADRDGNLKPGVFENVQLLAMLLDGAPLTSEVFDELIRDGCVLFDLQPKQKADLPDGLLYPVVKEALAAALQRAREPLEVVARMAADCQELLTHVIEEREVLTFDYLLEATRTSVDREPFRKAVEARFDAAIVDEFQDTDPLQWAIFQKLFIREGFPFVVVGDPKQSIYAFRNADIHSYLDALHLMGEERRYSLGTNYRSRPKLIAELNRLFGSGELFSLPYLPVAAGVTEDNALSSDDPVRFVVAEEKVRAVTARVPSDSMETERLFPFIGAEIERLRKTGSYPYGHFAILVRDRYQAKRLTEALQSMGIPCQGRRGKAIAQSTAFALLEELFLAVLDPTDTRRLRRAMGGPLVGLHSADLRALHEGSALQALETLHNLQDALREKGFFPFFEEAMERLGSTQRLLKETGGKQLFSELRQTAAVIAQIQWERGVPIDKVAALFEELRTVGEEDEEAVRLHPEDDEDGVQILTTFASKGLEFGVVFALGTSCRGSSRRKELALHRVDGETFLSAEPTQAAVDEQDAEKLRLLYVALTRAKDRVYIPYIRETSGRDVAPGLASPVELLVDRIGGIDPFPQVALDGGSTVFAPSPEPVHLTFPKKLRVPSSPRVIQSFTSLAKTSSEYIEKPKSDLPAGAQTGLILHDLLETIPWRWTSDRSTLSSFIDQKLAGTSLDSHQETVTDLLFESLNNPLRDPSGTVLSQVDPSKILREMEFLYGAKPPLQPGCVTGVIDLLFEKNGSYYLLDWKSNLLLDDSDEAMEQEMEHHQYKLQAKLYVEALRKMLSLMGKPFENHFGGVFYLFLRSSKALFYNRSEVESWL